jgi:hypothetical protein
MKKQYTVKVSGCDDSTSIEIELTQAQFDIVDHIAKEITAASTCICMPRMSVQAHSAEKKP